MDYKVKYNYFAFGDPFKFFKIVVPDSKFDKVESLSHYFPLLNA